MAGIAQWRAGAKTLSVQVRLLLLVCFQVVTCGCSSVWLERLPSKQNVASSNLACRSKKPQ